MRDANGRFVKTAKFKVGDRVMHLATMEHDPGIITRIEDNCIASVKWAVDPEQSNLIDNLIHFPLKANTEPLSIYRRAVKHFGESAQIQQATEELAELIVALSHHRRGRVVNSFVCSEIADVEIMCAQLREIFGSDAVDAEKAAKIARLAKELAK